MSPSGEESAAAGHDWLPLMYAELRRIARHYIRRQPPGFTLRPTELVHEACIRLIHEGVGGFQDEAHLRAIAAKQISQAVVDHVRRRSSKKRGGGGIRIKRDSPTGEQPDPSLQRPAQPRRWSRVPLESIDVEFEERHVVLLDLADALEDLQRESRRLHDVVVLRWFGGLKNAEVARHLKISTSAVEKDHRHAIAWLSRRLEEANLNGD